MGYEKQMPKGRRVPHGSGHEHRFGPYGARQNHARPELSVADVLNLMNEPYYNAILEAYHRGRHPGSDEQTKAHVKKLFQLGVLENVNGKLVLNPKNARIAAMKRYGGEES